MIGYLIQACQERASLGQKNMQQLYDHLSGLNELELQSVHYHSQCRKTVVNKSSIDRLRNKRSRSDSPNSSTQGYGRPSSAATESGSARPKRLKTIPKEKMCIFSSCDFCSADGSEPLHRVFSDDMGKRLIEIQEHTNNDQVRICVADLESDGDASAGEKYYHRNCLRTAQRTSTAHKDDDASLIRSLCDEELIGMVQNTLMNDIALNMIQVNDMYLSILQRYDADIIESRNYRRHLKRIIEERLPHIKFTSSVRQYEPDVLTQPTTIKSAIDLKLSIMDNNDQIESLKKSCSPTAGGDNTKA